MCQKKAGLHSCGHNGPVNTELCPEASLRLNPALSKDAATFDAACNVSTQTVDRDYCCSRKCCSQQIKITYDASRKAGAAKADFPEPKFMQRSFSGKPKLSYLAKKEEVRLAYLQASQDHSATKEKHGLCRQKQDEANAKRRAESGVPRGAAAERKVERDSVRLERDRQKRLEEQLRRRFGEVQSERRDLYFPRLPAMVEVRFSEPAKLRRPPPPPSPDITSYGAPPDHQYVREWLPRVTQGGWSERSRSERTLTSTADASGIDGQAPPSPYAAAASTTSDNPSVDEWRAQSV